MRVDTATAAGIAGVQPCTVRQWVHRGHLARLDGGIDAAELLHWLEMLRRNTTVRTACEISEAGDPDLAASITRRMAAPGYVRRCLPAAVICARYDLTPQTISNWVARSERTGVRRYRGGYDPNEILRWLVLRGGRATRRDRSPRDAVRSV